MTEQTNWEALKERCAENKATLTLRSETIKGEYRFSLAAVDKDGAILWDQRDNDNGYAPQTVITGLVNSALDRWFT